jgi:N-methylhydantoinase A/oxoprolinase/acetone carboxylase beta subunit
MILGLDVGGTQTDTVLIDENGVLIETKTPTGEDLLETLRMALEKTFTDTDLQQIDRMVFSTTLATNAIVQNQLEAAGMIVSAGPGMDPSWFSVGPSYHAVEGCIDHQGFEAMPLNEKSVREAAGRIQDAHIKALGVVTKFSVHNPAHEIQISDWVGDAFSHVALGHQVSGILNFPRRIATTYLNAALFGLHREFSNALIQIFGEKNLKGPRFLLKPDGGTVELERSADLPARTAQSGPAASVMGALALDGCKGTTLVLDIGGTTTDMSVVLNGVPLRAPYGIRLGPFHTLIRSLLTRSIGLGGDSEVRVDGDGEMKIGPERKGRPVAFGGAVPTPTDAMVTLGLLEAGSPEAASASMENLGSPLALDAPATAKRVLELTAKGIADAARSFIEYINSRPVYTIHEVLKEQRVEPGSAVIIGGPANQIGKFVGKAMGLPYRVPPHFGVANAVGAAVASVTAEITLQADTERGTVIIPEANVQNRIDASFSMNDAVRLARNVLRQKGLQVGADPETLEISITNRQAFNMIRGFSRTGQNIRLNMCIAPGLIPEWRRSQ